MSWDLERLKKLYRFMATAREIDAIEQEYTARGEAFFHVSGAGHESSAVLNEFLIPQDWLNCHYRDKALMLSRGIKPEMFFMSLFNKEADHSKGRQMNAHMSAPELNIMSIVGPVGNSGLHAVGVASVIKSAAESPIVLCSLGDGMTQQGEILEAIAHAARDELPVLFLVEDNHFAISTITSGRTFYDYPAEKPDTFYGIPLTRINGRKPHECYTGFKTVVRQIRLDRKPQIVIMDVERLHNHTNADDQRVYRSQEEIANASKTGDPLLYLAEELKTQGLSDSDIKSIHEKIREELRPLAQNAQLSPEPSAFHGAKKSLPSLLTDNNNEYTGSKKPDEAKLSMIDAIRKTFASRMQQDARISLFGEDLEDPKGDVFGLTRGLSEKFPGRVTNSPLAEATIVGVAIGQALAGKRPVAFLQFADFLPIAYNQIISELGSMFWRTDGGWQAPVILMITCGGYRPGLGPFHASSYEALAVHCPGVDVYMPSSAGDAAGLLNAAFTSERPTLFFYPKNLLNDRTKATSEDVAKQLVIPGISRKLKTGDDLTMVAYGNTVALCEKAVTDLNDSGVTVDLIDLRSLSPWDKSAVINSVKKTGRLLVTHEDNQSAGMAAEIISTVAEAVPTGFKARRVTRADTYVPCNFTNQLEILPSYQRILETAVELLGASIKWEKTDTQQDGSYAIEAMGFSPSDEEVSVIEWLVKPGDKIKQGQQIAEVEADKAAYELMSPVNGTVDKILLETGFAAKVGEPIMLVNTKGRKTFKPLTKENPGLAQISGIDLSPATLTSSEKSINTKCGDAAGIVAVTQKRGGRSVSNAEIAKLCPYWQADEISRRIGIDKRPWITEDENVLSLASDAALELLNNNGLTLEDIDLILCATGTPEYTSPSLASQIQFAINQAFDTNTNLTAYDFSAACSGYIYGLAQAYDYLVQNPAHRVLLITSEVLSPKINFADHGTAAIFADAASATLLVGSARKSIMQAKFTRPVLGGFSREKEKLAVPVPDSGYIEMDGPDVYKHAVKYMIKMIEKACNKKGIAPEDLALVVPHQANQRINNAIRQKMGLPESKIYSNIAYSGNTSSSTIPLCLEEILPNANAKENLCLVAFGGGYTYGGVVLEILDRSA